MSTVHINACRFECFFCYFLDMGRWNFFFQYLYFMPYLQFTFWQRKNFVLKKQISWKYIHQNHNFVINSHFKTEHIMGTFFPRKQCVLWHCFAKKKVCGEYIVLKLIFITYNLIHSLKLINYFTTGKICPIYYIYTWKIWVFQWDDFFLFSSFSFRSFNRNLAVFIKHCLNEIKIYFSSWMPSD